MKDQPQTPPTLPLEVAQRIHQKCEQFEDAWSGPARPKLDAFLGDVAEPERTWLLAELLSLEVELRQGAGEQPTEAEYQQSFPGEGDRNVIAAAFRRCADFASEAGRALPPAAGSSTRAPTAPEIENYDILAMLGRGGMGVVYKARDRRLKRLVALKMILAAGHAGAEQRARFRAEAEMVARLQHPNIAQIFDVGEQDGHPYIAFEFMEGKTLADFAGREPQPPRVAAELLETLARAMQYAHQQGIVHRDLKPANVLVSDGVVSGEWSTQLCRGTTATTHQSPLTTHQLKITDFGLAKDLGAVLEQTSTGTILGTPNYMSPEQAEGRRDIGPASDIYSLGAILYALLIGRPPFQGTTPISTLKMVVSTEPVPPSQLLPHLPRDLETICLKCLHKDPARRYETAGALADDLRRFLNHEPILARPSGRLEKTWRWCRRNPAVAALMASVLLVLALGVVASSYFAYTAHHEAKTARQAENKAGEEKTRAEAHAQRARERAYLSDMRLLQRSWDEGRIDLVHDLLDGQRPEQTDGRDVRGFEWHYWRRLLGACPISRRDTPVNCACFSPDGKRLASGNNDKTVRVWDVGAGQEILTLKGHTEAVDSVCFSPDGKHLASGSNDKTVRVWDAETGQQKQILRGHTDQVFSVSYRRDGKRIVSGSHDQTVKIWDAETGVAVRTIAAGAVPGRANSVHSVCFSPDGQRIAVGSDDKRVLVWDAETGQEKLALKGHTAGVSAVCYSPDGKWIVSGSDDRTAKVWDAATGQEHLNLKGHGREVTSVCFSSDGKQIASTSRDKMVKVWDTATGQEKLNLTGHPGYVACACFSTDGNRLASCGYDGSVRAWSLAALAAQVRRGHQSQVTCLACSRNGRWLASSGGVWHHDAFRYSAGELRLWDLATGAGWPFPAPRNLAGHSSGVTCVGFSPDGRFLASGSGAWDEAKQRYTGGEVRLWDPASAAQLACLEGHTSSVLCLAISPDSRLLASGGLAGGVLVRRLSFPFRPGEGPGVRVEDAFALPGLPSTVTTLAFSPDGRFLAGGGWDNVVKIWDLTERSEVTSLPSPNAIASVAYRPDGKQLAVAAGSDLRLYDATTYKEVRRLLGHTGFLTHAAYSPDGRRIATAHEDSWVQLWDCNTGQATMALKGHTGIVRCVKFSPDGRRLYSGSWDRTIRVWDATPLD